VAVTFAEKAVPRVAFAMPLFVAASVFGAMNGQVLGSSRVYFQGACDGCLPRYSRPKSAIIQ
jgi:L-type amino acid transporter 8